jgi:hypothetical protein
MVLEVPFEVLLLKILFLEGREAPDFTLSKCGMDMFCDG